MQMVRQLRKMYDIECRHCRYGHWGPARRSELHLAFGT